MVNKNELKAVMVRYGDHQEELAAYLGITVPSLCNKINGKADFWRAEIDKIAVRYHLTAKDIQRIFFARNVA